MQESDELEPESPVNYFAGEISMPRPSLRYRLGLAVVCGGMVILPLAYLALALAVIGFVVLYAVTAIVLISAPGFILVKLALYLGPVVAGLIVVVFLLKPVFARPVSETPSFSLSHEDQPELFRFLGRLCQLVNAPPPSRVDVNCTVNAYAGFRGGWRSFFGNDLVLTLGLPLVAGLSARQFAAVVAHELGHFAQNGAIRSGYLIETINGWFYRAVYDRDEWDVWLAELSQSDGLFISLVVLVAKVGVWLSRKVLFALMYLGVALSRYLSRQMEFDADNYSVKVAGSAAVIEMMQELRLIGMANNAASQNLSRLWRQRKLVDDFSALVVSERGRISPEIQALVKESVLQQKSVWHSTHPSPAERIAAAERLAEAGVFTLDAPARVLFRDFDRLSRAATQHHYEQERGLRLSDNNYKPVEEAIAERAVVDAGFDALAVFAPGAGSIWWPVAIDARYLGAPADVAETRAALATMGQQIAESKLVVTESTKALIDAENRTTHLLSAKSLVEAGIEFEATDFGLPEAALPSINSFLALKNAEIATLEAGLETHKHRYGTRFMAAGQLLYDPGVAEKVEGVAAKQEEVHRLITVVAKIQRVSASLREVGYKLVQLESVYRRLTDSANALRVDRATRPVFRELRRHNSAIRTELLGVTYPFEHASGKISLIDFCRPDNFEGNEDYQNYLVGKTWIQRLPAVYTQCLTRLASIFTEVELAVGIAPSLDAENQ